MKKILLLLIIAGFSFSASASDLNNTKRIEKQENPPQKTISLKGTYWKGQGIFHDTSFDFDSDYYFNYIVFLPDGKGGVPLDYTYIIKGDVIELYDYKGDPSFQFKIEGNEFVAVGPKKRIVAFVKADKPKDLYRRHEDKNEIKSPKDSKSLAQSVWAGIGGLGRFSYRFLDDTNCVLITYDVEHSKVIDQEKFKYNLKDNILTVISNDSDAHKNFIYFIDGEILKDKESKFPAFAKYF